MRRRVTRKCSYADHYARINDVSRRLFSLDVASQCKCLNKGTKRGRIMHTSCSNIAVNNAELIMLIVLICDTLSRLWLVTETATNAEKVWLIMLHGTNYKDCVAGFLAIPLVESGPDQSCRSLQNLFQTFMTDDLNKLATGARRELNKVVVSDHATIVYMCQLRMDPVASATDFKSQFQELWAMSHESCWCGNFVFTLMQMVKA